MSALSVEASSCRLRHHLGQEDTGHDRKAGKVVAEELFMGRQSFRGNDLFAWILFMDSIDQDKAHFELTGLTG